MSSKAFLIDSNVLMNVYRLFGIDTAPYFWDTIKERIESHEIIIIDSVKNEIDSGKDELAEWVDSIPKEYIYDHRKEDILLCYSKIMEDVSNKEEYTESAFFKWADEKSADPWIVSTAWANSFTIVTNETGKAPVAGSPLSNAKIPTIAAKHGVETITLRQMMKKMGLIWS